jgi:hypothetical protein
MILLDLSQIFTANLMVNISNGGGMDFDEDMLRHMALNSIRAIRKKYAADYGEMIICADDDSYWRKSVFPYYKASRKKAKEQSDIDWKKVYACLRNFKSDLNEHFPYRFLQIEGCEADDIIGTICHAYGDEDLAISEKILIVSGDKDYLQLQRYSNVSQYDPVKKRELTHAFPERYLFEHILKGDTGDGIPNILSQDDCFVMGVRQKPVTQKRIENWDYCTDFMKEIELRGFRRNEMLIDLSKVPEQLKGEIIAKYQEPNTRTRSNLINYFMKNRLKNLMEAIADF